MKRDHTEMLAVLRKASMLQVAGSALSFAVEFVLMLGYTFLLQSRIPPFPYLGLINGIVGISTISYCFTLIQGAWAIDQTVDQFGKMDAADAGAGLEEISRKAQTARGGSCRGLSSGCWHIPCSSPLNLYLRILSIQRRCIWFICCSIRWERQSRIASRGNCRSCLPKMEGSCDDAQEVTPNGETE